MQHYRCHPLLRLILHTCHFSSFQFSIHLLVTCHIHLNRASLLFLPPPPHHIFLLQHSQLSRRIQIGFNILHHPHTINRYTTARRINEHFTLSYFLKDRGIIKIETNSFFSTNITKALCFLSVSFVLYHQVVFHP